MAASQLHRDVEQRPPGEVGLLRSTGRLVMMSSLLSWVYSLDPPTRLRWTQPANSEQPEAGLGSSSTLAEPSQTRFKLPLSQLSSVIGWFEKTWASRGPAPLCLYWLARHSHP